MRTIYLTFDLDWACDAVLEDLLGLLERSNARATLLATHATPLLGRMRETPDRIELGAHPNFNPLLAGTASPDSHHVLSAVKEIVPEATCIRSHSLLHSAPLWDTFLEHGFSFDLNTFIPFQCGMAARPIRMPNGLLRIPYCWEDGDHAAYGLPWNPDRLLASPGLLVLNFHPIHVYLNTESMERYESCRPFFGKPSALRDRRNPGPTGTRSFLQAVLEKPDLRFGLIREIRPSDEPES